MFRRITLLRHLRNLRCYLFTLVSGEVFPRVHSKCLRQEIIGLQIETRFVSTGGEFNGFKPLRIQRFLFSQSAHEISNQKYSNLWKVAKRLPLLNLGSQLHIPHPPKSSGSRNGACG